MRSCRSVLLVFSVLAVRAAAGAQDFGVLESAETINRGNFKLTTNPMFIVDDGTQFGLGIKGGYGFTSRFDMEAKVAFYDDGLAWIGGDAEYWIVRGKGVDVSLTGGFHAHLTDRSVDTTGVDITLMGSGKIARALDLFAALDLAFESFRHGPGDYETVHIVPGLEYSVSDTLDLVGEIGLALNDDASHYVSGGLAFYFR